MADDAICPAVVQIGPVGDPPTLITELSAYLHARGHTDSTHQAYLASVEHFLRWSGTKCDVASVDTEISHAAIRGFLENHLPACRCPDVRRRDVKIARAALHQLLAMVGKGPLRADVESTSDEIESSIADFDYHLRAVCGLVEATRWGRRRDVRAFLFWLFAHRPLTLSEITPSVLMRFVTERAGEYRPSSIGALVCSLRSYLRFRAFRGEVPTSLASAIPRPRNWSLAGLPSSLDPAELTRFLAAFDRTSPTGQRDYAMARCCADLGLRCCEVASMSLDAIDWRGGVLRLPKTKANREDRLPLPEPTGQALADYLRYGRPETDSRSVFVYHRAPTGQPVRPTTVRGVVRRAFSRAGLPWSGPHVLRRTMATRLLQGGATLKEIADVLRHCSLDTTNLYTKVDLAQLARVALPWPGRLP